MYLSAAGRQSELVQPNLLAFSLTGPITITQTGVQVSQSTTTLVPASLSSSLPLTTSTAVSNGVGPASVPAATSSLASSSSESTAVSSSVSINTSIPVPTVSVINPTASSPAASALEGSGALETSSISKGTIAAIAIVVVAIIVVAAIFIIRTVYKRSRAKKRKTMAGSFMPATVNAGGFLVSAGYVAGAPQNVSGSSDLYQRVQPPQTTYLNVPRPVSIASPGVPFLKPIPYPAPPSQYKTPAVATPMPPPTQSATVLKTFVPTLPDELSILAGERVIVLKSFDDGWALCCRSISTDEKGMVPLECLELDEVSVYQPSLVGGMSSKRLSSLSRL